MAIRAVTDNGEKQAQVRDFFQEYVPSRERKDEIVIEHDSGYASYVRQHPRITGEYIGFAVLKAGIKAQAFRTFVLEVVEWMFLNTPCTRIWGYKGDSQAWEGVGISRDQGTTHFTVDIGTWAKWKGLRNAVDALNAAGQTTKARKLSERNGG